MTNTFYTDFDTCCLDGTRKEDYRSPFEVDRDRIIHTSAFRRLQAKTQVFMSGEYDFYRTRLTHSLEVAQIGRSICGFLLHSGSPLSDTFFIDPALVEAICLTHDLGHPPFGHAGERTLNQLMADHGGFEGNAQTLRLITETIYSDGGTRRGMNPSRAFLDGILKYKRLYSPAEKPSNHFLYEHQRRFVGFAFEGRSLPASLHEAKALNNFRSIECQIMDWADDVAYSINDVSDGVRSGFLTPDVIEQWSTAAKLEDPERARLRELVAAVKDASTDRFLAGSIGRFIAACRLEPTANFMSEATNRYRFWLVIDPAIRKEAETYKRLSLDVVFLSPQLQQLEHKGARILRDLFAAFAGNYAKPKPNHLLPSATEQALMQTPDEHTRLRLLCDHIAGMTDGYAIRTYKRLFDPEFGSLADLV